MQLSRDESELLIYNKKLCDTPLFHQTIKHAHESDSYDSDECDMNGAACKMNNLQKDLADELFNDIRQHKSSKSCRVDDIEDFVYGPFTSRFWMMRKHICLSSIRELSYKMTFHAWDCITISVKGQSDIFLIITNQEKMFMLIKFLIYKLETVDG